MPLGVEELSICHPRQGQQAGSAKGQTVCMSDFAGQMSLLIQLRPAVEATQGAHRGRGWVPLTLQKPKTRDIPKWTPADQWG